MTLALIDHQVLPIEEAKVPLMDRGYLLGDGVFETMRTTTAGLWQRERHMARLRAGMAALGLAWTDDVVADLDVLVAAGHDAYGDDLYVRLNVSTGAMEGITEGDGLLVTGMVRPFQPYPLRHYSHGVHVVTSKQIIAPGEPLAGHKTLSFLRYVQARREAMALTAHDAVLTDGHGSVVEASTSNVFARTGDVVHAPGPDQGAVDGVTRQVVLELIDDAGLEVAPTLSVEQLAGADEAWLTNTTGGVVPVTRFDEVPIADGAKGDLTRRVGHAYEDLLRGRA